jgi:YD repeat-containing protein
MSKRMALRAKRTGSGSAPAFQDEFRRAIAAVIEPLERRVMLTASPQISGPAIADAGAVYSLSLAANSNTTVSSWAINWGDGSGVTHLSGNPSSATHVFFSAGSYDVSASVTDADGTYSADDKLLAVYPTSAAFVGSDGTTLGNWVGTFGADGFFIPMYSFDVPAYAQFARGGVQDGVWQYDSMDARALVAAPGGDRIAANDSSATSFTYNLNFTDGNAHQLAMYVMDFDAQNRAETVTISDANTGATLSSQSVTNFSGGRYLMWNLQGQITITVTNDGGPNAVVSGLFFGAPVDPSLQAPSGLSAARGSSAVSLNWDAESAGGVAGYNVYRQPVDGSAAPVLLNSSPLTSPNFSDVSAPAGAVYYKVEAVDASGEGSAPSVVRVDAASSASFVASDVATQGTWVGTYGSSGIAQFGGAVGNQLPSYVQLTDNGQRHVWQYGPTQTAAMQNGTTDPNDRTASCDYSLGTLTLDLNLTDGQAHQVAIYMVDWDNQGRQQTVQIDNADTGAELDTQTVSNFQDGVWLVWTLQGHVTISIASTTPGMSAVVSGLMLDPADTLRPAAPANLTAAAAAAGAVQLQWSANPEEDLAGYNVYRRSSSSGPFVQLNTNGPLTSPSYTDASPPFGVICYYRVVAVDTAGRSSFPSSIASPFAAVFLGSDTTTQGSWVGTYGTDGYYLAGNSGQVLPSYALLKPSGQQAGLWQYYPSNGRALVQWQGQRIAACDLSTTSFSYDLDLTDGQAHQVALYMVDFDDQNRVETVQVNDSVTGALLSPVQTVSNFSNGQYLLWNLQGHVTITVTCAGGPNAVASGLFFDPAGDPAVPKPTGLTATRNSSGVSLAWTADGSGLVAGYNVYREPAAGGSPTLLTATPLTQPSYLDSSAPRGTAFYYVVALVQSGSASGRASIQADASASATFIEQDLDTQGNWVGTYGSEGYAMLGGAGGESLPAYVQYSDNASRYVWQYASASPVALQAAPNDTADRAAGTDYVNGTLDVNLTITDGQPHEVALYMMDFDDGGRQQTVQVSDADTGAVLDTRSLSNFQNGVWLVWNLQGHITISISPSGGQAAVLSAIMFGPPASSGPAGPTNLSAIDTPSGVQLQWTASTASDVVGYNVYRRSSATGPFTQLNRVPLPGTSYTDLTAPSNSANFYQVVSVTADGRISAPATVVPSSVSFVRADAGTQGSWVGVYGADGFENFDGAVEMASYAQTRLWDGQYYSDSLYTPDVRALQDLPADPNRAVSGYGATDSFTIDLNLTDGQTHQVALYLLDWQHAGLSETVQVFDAASGQLLNTQSVSNFNTGLWLVWMLSGHVTIQITGVGGSSCVASGLYFDTPPVTRPAAPSGLTATSTPSGVLLQWAANTEANLAGYNVYRRLDTSGPFTLLNSALLRSPSYDDTTAPQGQVAYYRVVAINTIGQGSTASSVASTPSSISSSFARLVATDTTTQGSWQNVYGSDGYSLLDEYNSLPSYVTADANGSQGYVWLWGTTDSRAVQIPAQGTRIASSAYATSAFTVDLDLIDGQTHQVALYLLDWDTSNLRTEFVQISDAATGTVLDTRSVSDFSNGVWLVWELQGHVDITIRSTNSYSAVASAIMFAPAAPAAATNLSATPVSAQQVTLSWSAAPGLVSGYDVQRSTDGVNFTTIATGVLGTSFHDLTAQPTTTYTYRVRAETGGVESTPTNSATATTPAAAPPATPTGLTATATGANAVSLSWNPVAWATMITIDRVDPNGNSRTIATLNGSATSFDDDNSTSNPPQEDTTYTYHVTATNQYSPADPGYASVQCTTLLAAPSNLSLTLGQDSDGNPQITLNWSNNTGDQNSLIQIERSTNGTNFADLDLPPDWDHWSSSYIDTGLSPAKHYWYRIQAVDQSASLVSALVSADTTTASASSNDPSVPTLTAVSASEIDLTWDAYTPDDGKTVTAFEVDRSTDGVNFTPVVSDLAPSSTSYNDTSLTCDTHYWYVIRAIESDGSTPASPSADAWTAPVAPQNLIVAGSPTEMDLSWTYAGDESSAVFQIMRKGPDDDSYTQLGPGQNGTNYRDTSSIIAGGNYLYYVIAVAGNNTTLSAPSNTAGAAATLSAPTGLTATAYDASSVVLAWNPVVGATGYNILRQGPGDTQLVPIGTTTTMPYYDSSVEGQSTYTYRVVATEVIDDQTSYQASSTEVSVTTPPAVSDAPTNLSAVASSGQIALTWSAPSGPVTGYNLWRSIGAGSSNFVPIALGLQATAYTDTQLVPGLTYNYYVQADNAGALSTASATVQASGVPDQPSGLTVTDVSSSSVELAWSDTAAALDYSVLREGPGQSSYSPIGTASGNAYTDTTVSPNQTYSYEVAAFDAGGESLPSASVTASTTTAPPPIPTGFFVSASDATSVSLAWNASTGAILYQILRRGIGDDDFILIGSSYQPSYIDTAVTAGDTYGYRVVAVNNSGASAPSRVAFARPPAIAPSAPSDLTLTDDLDGTVTLSWSASAGDVTAYHVQRSIDGMGFVQIAADVQGTSYVDTAPAGADLSYRVSAENAGSFSNFSNVASITLTPAPVAALTVSAVSTTSLTLSWAAPAGAFQYTVLRMGPGDSSYQTIASNIVPPAFTDTSVSAGSTYSYEVIATNTGGSSDASSSLSITIPAPAPSTPSGLAASAAASTQVTLSWAASAGAVTAYHVERSTDGVNFTEINSDVQATTYTDSGLQPDTSYTYLVRAENDGTFSDYSATASVTTPAASAPAMPANLTAIASLDGIALQWSANTEGDLAGYDILRSTSASGPFTQLDAQALTAPAYDDSSAPAGSTSYYQVQAVDISGLLSTAATASAIRPASVASTPANLAAAQVSAAGVLLTWTGPQGVTYNVYRDAQQIATGVQSSAYLDTGASAGANHSYTVSSTDNSGNSSAQSAALAVTTPAASTSYDAAPPSTPTGLTATADQYSPDSQIDLTWSASTDNVAVSAYEILRDGVQVGVTSGLTFNDTNLTPGSHTYTLIAFDADDNQSPPVTVSGSTGADKTAPNAPLDVQVTAVSSTSVTLGWVQPWDNVGVDHYDVTRSSNTYPYTTVDLGTTTTPSITASGLSAGTAYTFNVTAYDAAGNKSASASTSATTTGTAAVDQSPNQYIPQVWQNYFYTTLTAALRQKITQLPTGGPSAVTIPHASGWLSPYMVLLSNNLFSATNIHFNDLNGNGLLDPDEMRSISLTSTSSTNCSNAWYVGSNSNGIYVAGQDAIVADPWMIQGTSGAYEYCDLTGSGQYSPGDPVWAGGSVFQSGDTVIAGTPTAGMHGRTNGIYSYNAGGSAGPLIWADPDHFRQDFADFYSAMDALIPNFASGQAYPNDSYTDGSLLASIGATTVAGNGTISVQTDGTQPDGDMVTGSGMRFTTQLVPGDNIQIGGQWYSIGDIDSDTQLTLAQAYDGPSISGAAFSLINWTKVPATRDADTGLSFHFTRGEPDATSPLFPQQFQQLHDALQALSAYPRRYNQWLFDAATSSEFISVATSGINAADSLFGTSAANPGTTLKAEIQAGDANPGSVFTYGLLTDLRSVFTAIAGAVYARMAGGPGGWDTGSGSSPIKFTSSGQMGAALPAFSDALVTRLAGGFSDTPNVQPAGSNPPIDDVQITEVQSLLAAIENNGLWVSSGTPQVTEYKGTEDYYAGAIDQEFLPPNFDDVPEDGFIPPDAWPVVLVNQYGPTQGNGGWDQVAGSSFSSGPYGANQSGTPPYPYNTVPNPVLLEAGYSIASVELTAQVPPGNPYGGNEPGKITAGPQAGDIDMSGWTWDSTQVIADYSSDTILGLLSGSPYGEPGVLTPPDFGGGSGDVTTGPVEVAPHLYALNDDSAESVVAWVHISNEAIDYIYTARLYVSVTPAPVYGQVPVTNDFSYTPSTSPAAPPAPGGPIAQPPTDPLPLTTAMDYFNVMPDNGIDGIVNTPANLSSFGNDTGTVTFTAQNGMAQTLLPINVSNNGTLPVNGYLIQGDFGSADDSVGSLLSQDIAVPNSSQDGTPWAYSLDTHVRINLLVDDANGNHVKRIEVIRPGGNAVVFDFAWDATTGMFSPTGTPESWKGRDGNQTFVLRALQPTVDSSLNYELLFANGIVQTFNGNLQSVSDSSTGLTQGVSGGTLPLANGQQNVGISPRYNITLNWTNGNITSIAYQTKDTEAGGSQTISTNLSYEDEDVSSMEKSDADQNIADFSYSSVSADSITQNGVTTTRSGSMDSGSVTIATTLPSDTGLAGGSSTTEVYTFNEHDLVTSDEITLDEGDGTSSTAATSYQYQDDSGLYDNGSPKWSKVTTVTNPDGSWVEYEYDDPVTGPTTGWVTAKLTPFQSGDGNVENYGYDPTQSGNGQAPDPTLLVQPPDTVTDYVLGTQTGETFNNYDGTQIITREALSDNNPTWATALPFSKTTISAYDSTTTTSVTGNLSDNEAGPGNYSITDSWFGDITSESNSSADAFGDPTSTSDESLGQASGSDSAGNTYSFGRPLTQSLAGGQSVTTSYTNDDGTISFFGPASVVGADGEKTKYTYTPLGQLASEIDYAGTSYSVDTSYTYDAAGNVVKTVQSPVDSFGNQNGFGLVTTDAYDAQGRSLKEVTNAGGSDATANQTTTNVYTFDGTYNITATTNPDGSTNVTKTYLDGSTAIDAGNDQTPGSDTEGVVASNTTDANGNVETAGSTWVMSSSDGGQNWTKTFTNVLGEQYLVQQSDPSTAASPGQTPSTGSGQALAYSDAVTMFNLNGQPFEQIGTDLTKSFTIYDPYTGQAGASWTDVAGTGIFDPGLDPRNLMHQALGGLDTSDDLSTTGSQIDTSNTWAGGLDSSETQDGMTTTTVESLPTGPGNYTITTTNPDQTKTVDTYTDDLLTQEQQLGTTGAVITTTGYTYKAMRELATESDSTGTTDFTYYQDGTQDTQTDPGQNPTTDDTPYPVAGQPQTTTLPDGSTQTLIYDYQHNLISQGGAGQLGATYGYDENGTGQLTSLTTSTGTTHWAYDPTTGQLQSKTFADGTKDTYAYNDKGQLSSEILPGVTGTFGYDAAGDQLRSTYMDATTGLVQSIVAQQDDQGRAIATITTDNGKTFTETQSYTPLGDPESVTFGSADNTAVNYAYYPAASTPGNPLPDKAAPDALAALTVFNRGAQAASASYTYDPSSKRLQTITANGITITYAYLPESNQIQSVTIGNVTTTLIPDAADGSRLGGMTVTANGQTVYNASYDYNADNQRSADTVTTTAVDGSGNTTSVDASRGYTYDPAQGDALVSVQDGSGNTIETYGSDAAGNLTNDDGSTQTPNNVNQLSGYTFNTRGDVTTTANYTITWDALDRPIQITPRNPTVGSDQIQLGYDSQNRWLWKDVYQWSGSAWVYAYSRTAVWDGSNLVAVQDQTGALVQSYTWGPTGLALITDYSTGGPVSYVPIADASGNTSLLIDPLSGTVVASYTYDAYGNLLSASDPMKDICPFLGKGLYVHSEVPGLMFAQNRVTDGRIWLSRDPTAENGGLDLYQLYTGDPINLNDPSGLSVSEEDFSKSIEGVKYHAEQVYQAIVDFGKMSQSGASEAQLAHQAAVIGQAQDNYQTWLRKALYYGGSYSGSLWFPDDIDHMMQMQVAGFPTTIAGLPNTEAQSQALVPAFKAFGDGAGKMASHAATVVTVAENTKTVCDAIAIAGGIESLAELAAQKGIAIACERLAEVAATTAAFSLIDQAIDPISASLGIDPTWLRIGMVAFQCYSLYSGVCFPAGTLVATEHGSMPIETIEPGMNVWSYDAENDEWRLCEVIRRLEREYEGEIITVGLADEEISATSGHPFWVHFGDHLDCRPAVSGLSLRGSSPSGNGRWVQAGDLRTGDVLRTRHGVVEVSRTAAFSAAARVFNLTVASLHTYAVGSGGILVHNACPNPNGKNGGLAHQAGVADVEAGIQSRGLTAEREYRIETPGGAKSARYVDAVGKDGSGAVVEMHQVGRQTAGGIPVSRERTAMDDIEAASGQRPQFHPYNK